MIDLVRPDGRERGDRGVTASGQLEVRRLGVMTESMAQQLARLELDVFRDSTSYDDCPWETGNFLLELPEKSELSSIALAEGEPIAFLIASRRPDGGVHVHRLAVRSDFRARGVARAMLADAIDTSGATVTIVCDRQNAAARRVYGDLGFVEEGVTADGKLSLRWRAPIARSRIALVFNARGAATSHNAHLPGLGQELTRYFDVDVVGYGASQQENTGPLRWALAVGRICKSLRNRSADVVFVRILWPLVLPLRLFGPNSPVLLWSSGGVGYVRRSDLSIRDRVKQRLFRWTLKRLATAVVTGPAMVASEYRHRYGLGNQRILLAANDVNVERWQECARAAPPATRAVDQWLSHRHRLLFVHSLDALRGADQLMEITQAVAAELGDVGTLVVGDGVYRTELSGKPGLYLTGPLPNGQVATVMARAHCLVVPSRQEGFPRVALEALAAGVPPVCFDVGGCREVLAGIPNLIAPPGAVSEFARLVAAAASRSIEGSWNAELTDRAWAFDTSVVARRIARTIETLLVCGPGVAETFAKAVWLPTYEGWKIR